MLCSADAKQKGRALHSGLLYRVLQLKQHGFSWLCLIFIRMEPMRSLLGLAVVQKRIKI